MTHYKTQRAARRAWKKATEKLQRTGKVYQVQIAHDEWCGIYKHSECNCNPDRQILNDKGDVIVKVSGAGFYDPVDL